MSFKSFRKLFASSSGNSSTSRAKAKKKPFRSKPQLCLERLEERMVLSAPDPVSLNTVTVDPTSQGGQVSGNYFLGGNFDTGNQSVGSIASTPVGDFGAELNLNLSGQVGVNLGYSASTGGQIGSTYTDVQLQQNYSEPTQFSQQVNFTPQNTNVSYGTGAFSTMGPSVSASASLVANVAGSVGGTFAFFKSVGGTSSFSTNINQPLFNVGIGSSGNDLGLTLGVLGQDISNPVNDLASAPSLSFSANPAGPEIPIYVSGSLSGSTSPFGAHESLSLGVGEGEGDEAVGGSISLGSADQYIPDLSLGSTSLQNGGVLTDSEQGNLADLNIQAGPVVGALLAAEGFPAAPLAGLAGSDTLSVGSASVTFTPISFQVGPNLTLAQTSTVTPTSQLTYSFTDSASQPMNVDVTKNGHDLGMVSSVTFSPGVDNVSVKFAGTPITVTPTWTFTEIYHEELDLDVSFQGSLTAGSLSASFGDLSTPTLGPLYSQNFDFADYKIATLYDNSSVLPTTMPTTQTLPSFVIGSTFMPSLAVSSTSDSSMSGSGSLRFAVETANHATSNSPQIIHLGPGTYNLTLPPDPNNPAGQSGALYISGQNVVIEGAGPGQTIINASSLGDRAFNVAAGANLTLEGVTVTGGAAGQYANGGGILNSGTVTVSDSDITGNSAFAGGGIENVGQLTIGDSIISDNTSGSAGGGIYNTIQGNLEGTLTILDCTISGNVATGFGGGIANSGTVTVGDSTISGNQAAFTGGGGLYNSQFGTATLDDCTVSGNSAIETSITPEGGGIFNTNVLTLINSTISNNTVEGLGGGLATSTLAFRQNMVTTLINTIVSGNSEFASIPSDIYGVVNGSSYNNLVGNGSGESGVSNGSNGSLVGQDPRLAPLGNFGGPTETMPLLSGSPAIAAGTSNVPGGLSLIDQRGFARTLNGRVDIGAVENQYDLSLNGFLTPGTAPGTVEYVYTATNNGPDPVTGATLTVPLPPGTAFRSLTCPAGWTETDPGAGNNGLVVFTDTGILNSGQSANFTIAIQVQNSAVGATITNTATVGPTISDNTPQNNSLTLTITNEQEGQEIQQQAGPSFFNNLQNVNLFHFTDPNVFAPVAPAVGTPTVSLGQVSHNGTGALGNATYYYTVTTITASGESPASNEVSATTAGALNHVNLTWDQASGALGYKVYRGTSPGAESTLIASIPNGTTLSFTDAGFEATTSASPPKANHLFTASVGWGDNSGNTSNDGTGAISVVADPNGGFDVIGSHAYAEEGYYGTTVVVTANDGTVYTNGPQQNPAISQPLTNAFLYHFADANIPVARTPSVSSSEGSLAAGTYYYTVTSTTATGESLSSNEVFAITTGNNSKVALSWSQAVGATGYKVYRGTAPGGENTLIATITSPTTVSFTDDGTEAISSALPPTNIFTASVAWGDNSGNTSSDGSGTVSVVANPNGGFDVYGSHAYATASSYAIAVSVTGSDGTQVNGGLAYNSGLTSQQQFTNTVLYHFADDTSPFVSTPTVSTGQVSRNGTGALGNATYYYTVTSVTASGESLPSNEVVATTAGSLNRVNLTWNQMSGATGYQIYRGTSPGAENTFIATIASGTTLSFTDTGFEATSSASPPSPSSRYVAIVGWDDNSANNSRDGTGAVSVVADPNGGVDVLGSHAYGAAGSYGIGVTVRAPDGSQTSATVAFNSGLAPQQLFVVTDAPLTAGALTPPPFATINQPISNALLFHFTDADPSGTASDYTATVKWGDGTTSSSTGFDTIGSNGSHAVTVVADPAGGFDVLGSHTYTQLVNAGTFSVQVSDFGGSSTGAGVSNFQVQAPAQPLTAGVLNIPGVTTEGQTISNQLLFHFSDPDADAQASDYLATAFWGDGAANSSNDGSGSVSVVADPNGGFDIIGSHVYVASSGSYFGVKVTDLGDQRSSTPDLGGQITGAFSSAPLTIIDPPVLVTAGQTFTDIVNMPSAVQTVATFTDPGGPDTNASSSPYIATIQWGDGAVTVASSTAQATYTNATVDSAGKITGQISSAENVGGIVLGSDGQTFSVNLAHEYANQGNYTITIVLDHEGVLSPTVTTTALVAGIDNLTATGSASIASTFGAGIANATVATFTDTNTIATASDFMATITWGDGQSSPGVISGANGNFTVTGNHDYANAGNFLVGVTISNIVGTAIAMANTSATINPAAPTVTVSDASGAYSGQPFSAIGTALGVDGKTPVAGSFSFTFNGISGAPVNAGTYVVVATFTSNDPNYSSGNIAETTFTITSAAPTLSVTDTSATYNGNPFQAAATALGLDGKTPVAGSFSFTYNGISGAPVNAGTYVVVATFISSDPNYSSGNIAETTFTITSAAPTLSVTDTSATYNGKSVPAVGTALGVDGKTPVAGSFAYVYYAGASASGTPLSVVPVNAGTYTAVATFTSSNGDYASGGTAQTTFTISQAKISYTIGNDAQILGYPANLTADLPSSFNTGINGETLDITYSSSGDTSTAKAGTYAITGAVSNGAGLAFNYVVTLTNGSLTVLGSGVSIVGTELWIVGGPTRNDNVQVNPVGTSATGSTGVQVQATLNGVYSSTTFTQSFTAINLVLYAGSDNIQLAPTLTIKARISAGDGNDNVQLDAGNNTVTLGNGNDNVQAGNGINSVIVGNGCDNINAGNGNNTIAAGNGYDNVVLGGGSNVVTLGGGCDNVNAGNGNNAIIAGNGNDNISLGYGSNVVTLGSGCDNVNAGNGNNTVTLGDGNDNVSLGSGANTVMVGNGNDNINAGNGNNVISEGNGNDNISAGNGDNLIVAGLGQHNVNVGNGSNIIIDGSVQLTQSGDTLGQVLADWIQYGNQAANVASIRSRMHVTFNTSHANNMNAGGGLDWFWATYASDHLNANSADLRN